MVIGLKKIVIIDDEPALLNLIEHYTEIFLADIYCSYEIYRFKCADEAFEIIKKDNKNIDIIVTDINYPGEINGIKLGKIIREKYPNIKMIYMSCNQAEEDNLPKESNFLYKLDKEFKIKYFKILKKFIKS